MYFYIKNDINISKEWCRRAQHTVSAGAGAARGAAGAGERRRCACRLRNSRNSSFMARTRASTPPAPPAPPAGVDARSHS